MFTSEGDQPQHKAACDKRARDWYQTVYHEASFKVELVSPFDYRWPPYTAIEHVVPADSADTYSSNQPKGTQHVQSTDAS